MPKNEPMLRPLVLLIVLTLAWGMNWPVMKIGVTQLPPLWFRAISLVLGTALLGAMLLARGKSLRMPRGAAREVFVLALPNVIVWYTLVTLAITMLPAGRAAMLGFTMPAWATLIGVIVHREPIDGRTALGVACAVGGVLLLVSGDWNALVGHPLGLTLMLVASISWAWGTHAIKRSTLVIDTLVLTFWMMAFACPVVLAGSAVLEGSRSRLPIDVEWWPIAYNGVLVLAIGNVIWFTVARTLPPATAGLSSMLVPVLGVLSGMAMLGESPPWRDFVALALICIAVAAALIRRPAAA